MLTSIAAQTFCEDPFMERIWTYLLGASVLLTMIAA